jgi:hypothetical protein
MELKRDELTPADTWLIAGECAMNGVFGSRLVGSSDPLGRPTDDPEET